MSRSTSKCDLRNVRHDDDVQGFPSVSILRPGLLNRQEHARPIERLGSAILSSIAVEDVAKVMIMAAEKVNKPTVQIYSMKEMQQLKKQASAGDGHL